MNPTELDDDFRPGPRHVPRPPETRTPEPAPLDVPRSPPEPHVEEGDGLRPGDTGEGRVKQVARDQRPLGAEELVLLRKGEQDDITRQMLEVDDLLAEPSAIFKLPRLIASPLLGSILLGTGALLGVFLFHQTMAAAALIATLPTVW